MIRYATSFVHVACARYAALKSHLVCVGVEKRVIDYLTTKCSILCWSPHVCPQYFPWHPPEFLHFLIGGSGIIVLLFQYKNFPVWKIQCQLMMPVLCLRTSVVLEWAIDTHCHMKMPLITYFEKCGLYNIRRFNLSQVSHVCYISIAC